MYPILFSIGKVNFYTHGLMMALGCVVGGLIVYLLAKRKKYPTHFLLDTFIYSIFFGILGARLVYVIIYYYQFSNWREMFFIWYGGLVSLGGLFFGFLTAYLMLKKRKQNVFGWFDIGIIGLLFGWAIGRIGCFLAGDTPGIISSSKIAIGGQIPVALFESIWALISGMILLILFIKKKDFVARFPSGFLFSLGWELYLLGRFFIDFFRTDSDLLIGLKASQITSLLLFILIGLCLTHLYFYSKKETKSVRRR